MGITDVTGLHRTLVGGNLGKQVSRHTPGSMLNPSPHQDLISFTDSLLLYRFNCTSPVTATLLTC